MFEWLRFDCICSVRLGSSTHTCCFVSSIHVIELCSLVCSCMLLGVTKCCGEKLLGKIYLNIKAWSVGLWAYIPQVFGYIYLSKQHASRPKSTLHYYLPDSSPSWYVHPTKTLIILYIRAVWSVFAVWQNKPLDSWLFKRVLSKDHISRVMQKRVFRHLRSMIRAFAVRWQSLDTTECNNGEQIPMWDLAIAQSESESVHFAHVRRYFFSIGEAHITSPPFPLCFDHPLCFAICEQIYQTNFIQTIDTKSRRP